MFREPTASVKRGIGAEAERLGELLGAPAEVKYGPIAHGGGASKEDDGSET
jgi:hypothetical protein